MLENVKKLHQKSKTLDLEGKKVLVCCKLCLKTTCMVFFVFFVFFVLLFFFFAYTSEHRFTVVSLCQQVFPIHRVLLQLCLHSGWQGALESN